MVKIMKICCISLLFLLGCSSNRQNTISFLDEGARQSNAEIMILNDMYYTWAEMGMHMDPPRNKPFKNKLDSIKLKSVQILNFTDKILELKEKNQTFGDTVYDDLINIISGYKSLLDSLFPEDSILLLKTKKLPDQDINSLKNFERPDFNLLKGKIFSISNYTFEYYSKKMTKPGFRPNKLEGIVIPKSSYVYFNDFYEARLYLVYTDTVATNITIYVDNQKLKTEKGKAIFSSTDNQIPGLLNKTGSLTMKEPLSDFQYSFDFDFTYLVRQK